MTALAERLQVSLDDIVTFDDDAKKLVEQYHAAGWTSRRSSRGHVIAYSPDGQASASISRDSLRGRSGRNAAAPLKKWLRDQEKNVGKGAAFGIDNLTEATLPIEDKFGRGDMPVRITRALAKDTGFQRYVEALEAKGIDPYNRRLMLTGVREDMERWFVLDLVAQRVITHSPTITADEAYEHARDAGHIPALDTEAETDDDVKMFECPEPGCGKRYASTQHLAFHRKRKHEGFPCPECGEVFLSGNSQAKHREVKHGVLRKGTIARAAAEGRWCETCEKVFDSPVALRGHNSRKHPLVDADGESTTRADQILAALREAGEPLSVEQLAEAVGAPKKVLGPALARALSRDKVARVRTGVYQLVSGDDTVTSPGHGVASGGPLPVATRAVGGARDTGGDGDVTVSSPVTPLTDLLMELPDGDTAVDMVAQIRAVVTPPLVAHLRQLAAERDQLVADRDRLAEQNAAMAAELGECKARLDLLKEALGA